MRAEGRGFSRALAALWWRRSASAGHPPTPIAPNILVIFKRLDVKVGDLVEIEGRRYDVVSDKAGGVVLEPAVTTTVEQLHAEAGGRPLGRDEFDKLFGDLPRDGEG